MVLGASMAGLLAARVLTDFYDRVTVIERDVLDDTAAPRRGVPQSRQPHALLARCGEILEELFPGIGDELVAGGAHEWCDGDLTRFYTRFGGHLVTRSGRIPDPSALRIFYASRPFLESHVRRRVRALPTLTVSDGHDIDALTWSGSTVTGVRVTSQANNVTRELVADLVVDATGRGSRTPAFLAANGFQRPREDELTVNVCYVSVPVRIPRDALREFAIADLFVPGRPRGYAMFRCEDDTWNVAAGTLGKTVVPPASVPELMEFLEPLMPREYFSVLQTGEPVGDVALHRFPANRWRRYDRLDRFPDRLLVMGDAVCSFNPIYGQGMTVAAIEAMTMRDCLHRPAKDMPRRFHRKAARTVQVAWRTAAGSDLSLPEVPGPRTLSMKLGNAYIDRVLQAAESDPWVLQEFLLVMGMLQPPTRLMQPEMLRRLAFRSIGPRDSRSADAVAATA